MLRPGAGGDYFRAGGENQINSVYDNIGGAGGTQVRTAHLNPTMTPSGGNICFFDNHIEWRPFAQMTNIVATDTGVYFQF
jgi:hypothetical protein